MGKSEKGIKKVLLVAYAFPPIPYGGTYRCLRLCRGLEKYNVKCHVLTIKQYPDIPNDFGLLEKVPKSTVIHRTPIFDPWRWYQNIRKKHDGKPGFKFLNKIISLALRFVTFPDHMLFWVPFAFFKARAIIRSEGIQTVLVSSPPNSSQLIGFFLKKFTAVKWIADFRDPIFGNVAEVNLINPADIISRGERVLSNKYEGLIVRNADVLVANTKTHNETLTKDYGLANIVTIRNSYDPDDFLTISDEKFDKFTISHVGSVYGRRSADVLFAAMKRMIAESDKDKLDLQVIFIGHSDLLLSEKAKTFGVEQYVQVRPPVSHEKAISLMKKSHLLLLIKATGEWSKGQIPGKFYEYAGARKKILCIGPVECEVASLIKDNSLGYVIENDILEMVTVLKKEYDKYKNAVSFVDLLSKEAVKRFSSDKMTKNIINLLN